MAYLLDTNACIRILNGTSEALVEKLRSLAPQEVALCSVVKAELLFGARKSQRRASNLRKLERFFLPFRSLPFDDACADHYGTLRAELSSSGQIIGANDMMIAATALAYDRTLVSHNLREFQRVPGLRVESWEVTTDGT